MFNREEYEIFIDYIVSIIQNDALSTLEIYARVKNKYRQVDQVELEKFLRSSERISYLPNRKYRARVVTSPSIKTTPPKSVPEKSQPTPVHIDTLQILQLVQKMMQDGIERSPQRIVQELRTNGINIDKGTVNSILHSKMKEMRIVYDSKTKVYFRLESLRANNSDSVVTPISETKLWQNWDMQPTKREPNNHSAKAPEKVNIVSDPVFEQKLQQMRNALENEIAQFRKVTYKLSNGRHRGYSNAYALYHFISGREVKAASESPIALKIADRTYTGILVSTSGHSVIIGIDGTVGTLIKNATLETDPAFLLEKLRERLQLPYDRRILPQQLLDSSKIDSMQHQSLGDLPKSIEYGRLNQQQRAALNHVFSNPISFTWGPPGTGKTTTLGATVAQLIATGKSILLVAHSNVAVDVAMMSIATHAPQQAIVNGEILRIGVVAHQDMEQWPNTLMHVRGVLRTQNPELIASIELCEADLKTLHDQLGTDDIAESVKRSIALNISSLQNQLNTFHDRLREAEIHLINNARVVGCTLSKLAIDKMLTSRWFDVVMIDEASMCSIPQCVFASSFAKTTVAIYGDFRQLAPIAQADTDLAKHWLKRDIFDEAGIIQNVENGTDDPRMTMLTVQHRMCERIAHIPNSLFYHDRLVTSPDITQTTSAIVAKAPFPGQAVILIDTVDLQAYVRQEPVLEKRYRAGRSRFNIISALLAVQQVEEALRNNLSVGVTTPYRVQSELINQILSDSQLNGEWVMTSTG